MKNFKINIFVLIVAATTLAYAANTPPSYLNRNESFGLPSATTEASKFEAKGNRKERTEKAYDIRNKKYIYIYRSDFEEAIRTGFYIPEPEKNYFVKDSKGVVTDVSGRDLKNFFEGNASLASEEEENDQILYRKYRSNYYESTFFYWTFSGLFAGLPDNFISTNFRDGTQLANAELVSISYIIGSIFRYLFVCFIIFKIFRGLKNSNKEIMEAQSEKNM